MKSMTGEDSSFKRAKLRWTVFFTLVVVTFVSLLSGLIFGFALRSETRNAYGTLKQLSERVKMRIEKTPLLALEKILRSYPESPDLFTREGEFLQFLTPAGESLVQFGGVLKTDLVLEEGASSGVVADYSGREREYRMFTSSMRGPAGQPLVYMRVGKSMSGLSDQMRNLLKILAFLILMVTLISWIVGTALAGYVLRPLKESYLKLQRFTADASHNLKTPLSTIRLGVDMLLERKLDSKTREKLHMIDGAARKTQTLVEQLLLMARSQSDQKTKHRHEEVLMSDLLEEVALYHEPFAASKSIAIEVEAQAALNFKTSRETIFKAIGILLENAIKFSYENSRVILKGFSTNKSVHIRVIDYGPGIAETEREKIFERFYKSENSLDNSGSGMGLAIARELAQALGGEINLIGQAGRGSVFELKLKDVQR